MNKVIQKQLEDAYLINQAILQKKLIILTNLIKVKTRKRESSLDLRMILEEKAVKLSIKLKELQIKRLQFEKRIKRIENLQNTLKQKFPNY